MKKFLSILSIIAVSLTVVSCSGTKSTKEIVKETYVHQYGLSVSKNDWASRGSNGQVISTMKSGVVVTKDYRKGILHGAVTYSFPYSKTISKTLTYVRGDLIEKVEHLSSGMPSKKYEFFSDDTVKITTWYMAGTPQHIEIYQESALLSGEYFSNDNERVSNVDNGNGIRTNYDVHHLLVSRDIIENGVMMVKTEYYPNSEPQAITPFVDGRPNGEKKTFNIGGSPNTLEQWVNGKQEGITTLFNNGGIFSKTPYISNTKHGVEHRYQDGNVVEAITWDKGLRHGPTYHYIADTVSTDWYYQNKLVSKLYYEEQLINF